MLEQRGPAIPCYAGGMETTTKTKTKILVIDDDPGMREVCCAVLQAAGFDTSSETDGFQALLHLATATPDVILCDLNMPRMSGFEFLSVVRRKFPQVRVVAMSGAYVGDSIPGGVLADAGQGPDANLQDAEMIEDREERGDEQNRRQSDEGELEDVVGAE